MTVANKFFPYPFAEDGDTTPVLNPSQPGGVVSYQEGYTPNYEGILVTDPDALPIGRGQFNGLMNDITSALAQYQTEGTPQWIPAVQTVNGDPYSYDIYARVRYNVGSPGTEGAGNLVYENQTQGNTATPGADSSWKVVSGIGALPTGTILDYPSAVAPDGFLSCCNPSPINRVTYANLYSVLTVQQASVTLNTSGTLTGLTNADVLFSIGMPIEGSNIPTGSTIASIISNSSITISPVPTANATVTITVFPCGNGDGSTTFNIPNLSRRVVIGYKGSSTVTIGNVIGDVGGAETHTQTIAEMPSHNHAFSALLGSSDAQASAGSDFPATIRSADTVDTGGGDPFNIMQPSFVMNRIIKY